MNVPSFTRAWRTAVGNPQKARKAMKRMTAKAIRANGKAEIAGDKNMRRVPTSWDVD